MENAHLSTYTIKSANGRLLTCVVGATRCREISTRASQVPLRPQVNVGSDDPYVVIVKLSEVTYIVLF